MPNEIARQWFIPGDGIDRSVISTGIQKYLGNDATVRPGRGTGEHEGVEGFWIKAYRNLTSAMIQDLQAESTKWRKEQRATGTGGSQSPIVHLSGIATPDSMLEPYARSETYQASQGTNRPAAPRPSGDSPMHNGPFGNSAPRERPQADRMSTDRMQMDPMMTAQPERRYAQPGAPNYPTDARPYPDPRAYPPERWPYQQDQPMADAPYGRPPVNGTYGQERYPNYPTHSMEGPPPGYVRQGDWYVPVSSPYEPVATTATGRSDTQFPGPPYPGQQQPPPPPPPQQQQQPPPQPPAGWDSRDHARDPRDPRDQRYGPNDYPDPARYAYPSPAATVSSMNPRDHESVATPPQPSYGAPPAGYTDPYGRPIQTPYGSTGPQDKGYAPPPSRDSNYGRERPSAPPQDGRDARRRRVH